jgi:hypothetical protein
LRGILDDFSGEMRTKRKLAQWQLNAALAWSSAVRTLFWSATRDRAQLQRDCKLIAGHGSPREQRFWNTAPAGACDGSRSPIPQ